MKEKIIDYLLNSANSSIILRVKKEILGNITEKEEKELLDKILLEKNVQTIIQSQNSDGWFGNHFHGQSAKFGAGMFDNMEVGLRYLAEKGFSPKNEYISNAVNSFLLRKNYDYAVYRIKPPKAPDTDYSRTAFGLYLMRSSVIIRAGYEYLLPANEFINLKHDIDFSFKTFTNALNYTSADEAIDTHRKKLCFKQGTLWACMYDLRILAHSHGWRSKKNISLLADSVNRLFSFPQSGKDVYTYYKGQFYAPCWAFIYKPMLVCSVNDEAVSVSWFDVMELFARCGITERVAVLKSEYESMLSLIDSNLDINIDLSRHKNEFSWFPYGGIALEEDWKLKIRKQCDLLFRILLIIHYTEHAL